MKVYRTSGLPVDIEDAENYRTEFRATSVKIEKRWVNCAAEDRDFLRAQRAYTWLESFLKRKYERYYHIDSIENLKELCVEVNQPIKITVNELGALVLEILDAEPQMYDLGSS